MHKDVWALRGVEALAAGALVVVVYVGLNSGVTTQACHAFTAWWADRVEGMFAVEVLDLTVNPPRLDRADLPLPPSLTGEGALEPTADPSSS